MEGTLTAGAIRKITNRQASSQEDMTPVLQVKDLKLVNPQKELAYQRFKFLLSDGIESLRGILSTTQNDLVREGILQAGSIVRLNQFKCSEISAMRFVVVMELEVITTSSDIIG